MDKLLNELLLEYFNKLKTFGHVSTSNTVGLFMLSFIVDLIYYDYSGVIPEEDYNAIMKFVECLTKNSCMIPYEVYLKFMDSSCSRKPRASKLLNISYNQNESLQRAFEEFTKNVKDVLNTRVVRSNFAISYE